MRLVLRLTFRAGGYNLTLLSQFDKQGFPALDYLINGLGTTDAAIVTFIALMLMQQITKNT